MAGQDGLGTKSARSRLAVRGMLLALGLPWHALAAQAPPPPVAPPHSTIMPLPPAVTDDKLAIGGNDINARKLRTRMTVDVLVEGRGPYRFVVDSGADSSVVGQRIAQDLHLPAGTPANLNGTTDVRLVDRVLVDALTIGPIVVRNLEVPALNEADLGADGLLGLDVLVEQRLMMDFEKRTIRIEDARRPARMVDGEIVVTARRRRGQLILTEVSAGGRGVQAVIDTGAEITIGNLALRDKLLRHHRDQFVTVAATGVTGVTTNLQLAIIPELSVGRITLRNVPIAFADVPPFRLFGLATKPALLLGTDLLEAFRRVSLDFRARKVRFQLRRCGTSGVVIDTAPGETVHLSSDSSGIACQR